MTYSPRYSGLWLSQLTPRHHAMTCDYWFTVTTYGCTAHTAFNQRGAMLRWLAERGLRMTAPLVAHGEHSTQMLIGAYERRYLWDLNELLALPAICESREMDNGRYTLSRITEENGIRIVNLLNPNCKRVEFDRRECQEYR